MPLCKRCQLRRALAELGLELEHVDGILGSFKTKRSKVTKYQLDSILTQRFLEFEKSMKQELLGLESEESPKQKLLVPLHKFKTKNGSYGAIHFETEDQKLFMHFKGGIYYLKQEFSSNDADFYKKITDFVNEFWEAMNFKKDNADVFVDKEDYRIIEDKMKEVKKQMKAHTKEAKAAIKKEEKRRRQGKK